MAISALWTQSGRRLQLYAARLLYCPYDLPRNVVRAMNKTSARRTQPAA